MPIKNTIKSNKEVGKIHGIGLEKILPSDQVEILNAVSRAAMKKERKGNGSRKRKV